MAHGKLGTAKLSTVNNTTVYTAPSNCVKVEATIQINNPNADPVDIAVAITATPGSVAAADWIESATTLSKNGTYNSADLSLSPGESIVVKSTVAGPTVRVMGSELTKV